MNTRPPGGRPTGAARFSEPSNGGRRRRSLSAIGSTLALLALVAGVPAVLLLLAGPIPVPTSWPSFDDITNTVDSAQVLDVLVIVVWLAWLQFMVCVVVETLAAVRGGVLAAPIPFSGPSQRLARLLVASVLLAGTVVGQVSIAQAAVLSGPGGPAAGRAVAAAAPFSQSGAEASARMLGSAPVAVGGTELTAAQQAVANTGHAVASRAGGVLDQDEKALDGRKVYIVEAPAGRHHDSLWAIAERHLGDGRRYQEIYKLNEGRSQPDGAHLHLARLIQPGWRLIMPEDAVGVPRYTAHRSAPAPAPAPGGSTSGDAGPAHAQPPAASAPAASAPAASAPAASAPAGQAPVAKAPATHAPASQAPAPKTPASKAPASKAPATQAPATQAPASHAPGTQAPSTRAPATQAPVAPAPASKAPTAGATRAPSPVGRPVPNSGHLGEHSGAAGAVADPTAVPSAPSRIGDATSTSKPSPVAAAPGPNDATPPAGNRLPTRAAGQRPIASAPSAPAASAPAAPATSAPASASPAGAATPPAIAAPAHSSAAGPAGTASRPAAAPVATPTGGNHVAAGPTPADRAARGEQAEDGGGISPLGFELIGAGLLASALLATLLVIRRRRGRTGEPDAEEMSTEAWLRTGADADRGSLLDLALRSLPRSCRDVGRQLPQAYGAVVDDDGLDLLLTLSHPSPPPPWIATDEGLRWRLTYADAQHLVADGDSAYPLLASIGRDPQGRDALINLAAAAGPISVVGSPAMAAAVVRALALGLAGNPWSRGIEVLTCDLPATLPAIAAGRLVPCAGARDLTEQLEQGSGRMPRTGPIQILTGGPAPGSRPEKVAIYGAPLNAPIAQRLQALIVRRTELAVLVTGELPGAAWRLKVDDAGNLSCDELSLNVTANRLGDGSVERLHALFISASTAGPRPGMPAERVTDEAGVVETDDVTWAQAAVRVSILGEVEVRAPGMIEAGRLPLFGEIVAYLALHPAGAHPTVLASAIWPRGVTSDVRDGTLAQVRDWLGTGPDGASRIREGSDGRMRLSPEVPCDWDVLRTLVGRAQASGDRSRERDLLIRALHLVRGPVVGGISHGTYTWLPRTDIERQAETLIVDAADRLSQICADEGDQVAVEQAAAAGLRAVPEAQHLWRHIIRAEHTLGGPARLARVVEHLQFALATSGVDVDPETQALVEHLSSPSAAAGNAS